MKNQFKIIYADSELIIWLLHESGLTRMYIAEESGVAESTLSRIADGTTPLNKIRLGTACMLTDYALLIKSKLKD